MSHLIAKFWHMVIKDNMFLAKANFCRFQKFPKSLQILVIHPWLFNFNLTIWDYLEHNLNFSYILDVTWESGRFSTSDATFQCKKKYIRINYVTGGYYGVH